MRDPERKIGELKAHLPRHSILRSMLMEPEELQDEVVQLLACKDVSEDCDQGMELVSRFSRVALVSGLELSDVVPHPHI